MRKLPYIVLFAIALVVGITACSDNDNNWDDYTEWREENDAWLAEQQALRGPNGALFYSKVVPEWYQGSGVLIHFYNDTNLTAGNLRPLSTSQVKVKYKGELYTGAGFDSSYLATDSAVVFTNGPDLIMGWRIALSVMHVGDSVDVVIPWQQAYGINGNGGIAPYTNLKFSMKLVDIPNYELKP